MSWKRLFWQWQVSKEKKVWFGMGDLTIWIYTVGCYNRFTGKLKKGMARFQYERGEKRAYDVAKWLNE